ncbi:MAG: hypothetical protein Q8M91_19740 [Polaromonas sp.]|nr:hypothetical protein [Polaromonas sp.]
MDKAVKDCLRQTAHGLLNILGLSEVDLNRVSTKTEQYALYSKFVIRTVLANPVAVFTEDYVVNAYDLYQRRHSDDAKALVYRFLTTDESQIEYRFGYQVSLPYGIGLFLVALHATGAITLPMSFSWPTKSGRGTTESIDGGQLFASELLSFVRCLHPEKSDIPDQAFNAVGTGKKRREWFSYYGTRLLLATGWHVPGDANVDDLVRLRAAVDSNGIGESAKFPFILLVDVIWRKYGDKVSLSPSLYEKSKKAEGRTRRALKANVQPDFVGDGAGPRAELSSVLLHEASYGHPSALRAISALPGLSVDFIGLTKTWLDIEEAYLKQLKRENKKTNLLAIGWLNVYLFMYLPYWFAAHPQSEISFPDCPGKLLGGVFVTRLIDLSQPAPDTFMTMMNALQESRGWTGNSYYSVLKQVEQFLSFVERKSDVLPGCVGFRQPLTPDDYPVTTSRRNTNKRPIEKRLFRVTLDLTEALVMYSEAITDRILTGELDSREFQAEISRFGRVIDTFQVARFTGVIPILFYKGHLIPLRIIPNCLSFTDSLKLKGFDVGVQVPSPHALNQIFVALHTGIRHNHIQWLDARSFDKWVIDDESVFTQLLVNTDKRKLEAWMPYVAICVIERLRAQRRWRNLFDEPTFLEEHHYNDNSETKWEPIVPLFSFSKSGLPHSDKVYERVWGLLLSTLQGLLRELGEDSNLPFKSHGKFVPRIGMLEPSNVEYNDLGADEKRRTAGAKKYKRRTDVPLVFKTPMTPHSTRVSVVQQYMTYLPAEYVGKYFTGQTERTVHYYHIPDPTELARQGVHQAMLLRARANHDGDELVAFKGVGTTALRADDVNASLAKSLRESVDATIDMHGCVSLALANTEVSGIEVLKRTMAVDAVLNKTEICPYGNKCPSDVIKLLSKPNRCGLCPYAVRSVDHLPAVSAKLKQQNEELVALQSKIADANREVPPSFTEPEFEQMDRLCSDLSEDITGWQLSEEVLYHTLQKLKAGKDTERWVVQMPEAVLRDLRRIDVPSGVTAYTLARLNECIAFPTLDSPQIRARFDLMRRQLLARNGRLKEALGSDIPSNPAMECAGLLKTIVESHGLGFSDIVEALESDKYLTSLPHRDTPLLSGEA